MRRRAFIAGLAGAAAWPVLARGQQSPTPMVGWLSAGSPDGFASYVVAFRQGLKEIGYVEGQNVNVDYRWAYGDLGRLSTLAMGLVARQVAVIAAAGGSTLAAKNATTTIPIVGLSGGDPVQSGLAASLNRPGGNVTGVVVFANSLGAKRLELLRELIPTAKTIAILANPNSSVVGGETELREVETAARAAALEVLLVNASTEHDFGPAFATMAQRGARALVLIGDPFFYSHRQQTAALAMRYAISAIDTNRGFADAGGLMAYGTGFDDANRLLGVYVGKILGGAKPADLPFQRSVKVELVLNLRTAKALGITLPVSLLARADEVIE